MRASIRFGVFELDLQTRELRKRGIGFTLPWPMDCMALASAVEFYGDYSNHTLPANASPRTIGWERFTAAAGKRPFDAERFFR